MTVSTYTRGEIVRISASFTDIQGAAIDPAAVRFKWRRGGAAATTYVYGTDVQLVRESQGHFRCDIDTTGGYGTYRYRFESDAPGAAAAEGQFTVIASALD